MKLETLTHEQFKKLPLVVEGESKEVRYTGNGEVVIRLKPTIYSYTHNRTGIIEGSDTLRLAAIARLLPVLQQAGVQHTYREVTDRWIRSQLVLQPEVIGKPAPFRPDDLSATELAALPVAPPIEVVAKAVHGGTPKHRYFGMSNVPLKHGGHIAVDAPYPQPFIRFDWRNPMHGPDGTRLADEVLPEPMADWYIDTADAQQTALRAFTALQTYLRDCGLELWDICFFIAQDGTTMFGEVSPDCLRVRAADGAALDKDVWRQGGSSETVLSKWQNFVELLEKN
jgi:phosphoribosylaminoimidazole-succinocarboxamide synthase